MRFYSKYHCWNTACERKKILFYWKDTFKTGQKCKPWCEGQKRLVGYCAGNWETHTGKKPVDWSLPPGDCSGLHRAPLPLASLLADKQNNTVSHNFEGHSVTSWHSFSWRILFRRYPRSSFPLLCLLLNHKTILLTCFQNKAFLLSFWSFFFSFLCVTFTHSLHLSIFLFILKIDSTYNTIIAISSSPTTPA